MDLPPSKEMASSSVAFSEITEYAPVATAAGATITTTTTFITPTITASAFFPPAPFIT